jgi:integrase
MNQKINFTKKILEDLPLPLQGKRLYCYDNKIRGLALSLTSNGSKTFIVYRKINGKPERVTLGKFPDLSIENARNMAENVNSQIAQGKNPNEKKENIKDWKFSELFDQYIERYAKNHKKSWLADTKLYKLHLKDWQNKKIALIKRSDIERLHTKIGTESGKYMANRIAALLHIVFNKAIDWGFEETNPCNGIKKFKEKSRERFLKGDEISNFFESLNEEPSETFRDFFYICLLTGARRSNVQSMNWNDINFNYAEWRVEETKNGEPQNIPLIPQALTILKERYENKISDWVFPSSTSKSGHIEEPKKVWKNLLERAGIKDLRIHDLRRTLGSWQAATGANSYIIGKSLGHKTQQATAIYARLNMDPVRESVARAVDSMFTFVEKK